MSGRGHQGKAAGLWFPCEKHKLHARSCSVSVQVCNAIFLAGKSFRRVPFLRPLHCNFAAA